ncbi:hypothetical protein E4K64_16545 [Bradyrhizobium frederickii]|uniref:Uncharacterized protein n=1 Tax=Bradyrhizobium frederickii TaxID=2560054 RepID=A0A4Y9P4J6_9BRAD|nr:hypothetical protein [Bradyrhizobium frederickii]TFV75311.1 hypothetical protein E4K64_16545 [Bradyrhizobium frederickii]
MSNLIRFPGGSNAARASSNAAADDGPTQASRDRQWVLQDIQRHVAARDAYTQAALRAALMAEQNMPVAQIGQANLEAVQAYEEMREAARNLLLVMPTELTALIDLLLYLERNFSILPMEITHASGCGQSLAFDVLRTVRLSLRKIAQYGKSR